MVLQVEKRSEAKQHLKNEAGTGTGTGGGGGGGDETGARERSVTRRQCLHVLDSVRFGGLRF